VIITVLYFLNFNLLNFNILNFFCNLFPISSFNDDVKLILLFLIEFEDIRFSEKIPAP